MSPLCSSCTIEVLFETTEMARAALSAVSHEKDVDNGNRSKVNISLVPHSHVQFHHTSDRQAKHRQAKPGQGSAVDDAQPKLVISIEAQDIVALRATVNVYLRALQVFEGIGSKTK